MHNVYRSSLVACCFSCSACSLRIWTHLHNLHAIRRSDCAWSAWARVLVIIIHYQADCLKQCVILAAARDHPANSFTPQHVAAACSMLLRRHHELAGGGAETSMCCLQSAQSCTRVAELCSCEHILVETMPSHMRKASMINVERAWHCKAQLSVLEAR